MDERIDINQADVEALASLPGIGPARAAKMVEYRTAVHPFEEIIELAAVPGISERMVRQIEELIVVNGPPEVEVMEVKEDGPPVEEIEVETINSPNGSEALDEAPAEQPVIEETAEESEAPIASETAETDAAEEDESPVVVTMLETNPPPEPPSLPETEPSSESRRPLSPPIVETRVVETVQRRHFHLAQQLVGIGVGAVLGASLTLLVLFLLNGTLRFTARTTDLQLQLDEETSAIRQSQSSMTDEMGELTGQVTELGNDLAASEEAIDSIEEDVSSLESETAVLNDRLEAIDLSAEKFDNFLTGLRDLLITLQGLPPSPTSTTPISGTATITTTLTPEGTAVSPTLTPTPAGQTPGTGGPTRTPRPTATPIIE